MTAYTLAAMARMSDGQLHDVVDPEQHVTAPVVVDSRDVEPGGVFVAIGGERVDGHTFAADAVRAGALVVVSTRAHAGIPTLVVDDPVRALGRLARSVLHERTDLTVIGITGSNGKTTTKDLLASVLATQAETMAAPGSYNGEIGLPLSVLSAAPSTQFLVLEYGARGIGHIDYLTGIARPRVGVVLNVGLAHVGVFGDRASIASAKGELVEALPADGVAVLNADDEAVLAMRERTDARVMTFGTHGQADVRAVDITFDADGAPGFRLVTSDGGFAVQLQLRGDHQVSNACAVAAAASAVGIPTAAVADALSAAAATSRWRMEVTERDDGVIVVNDAYNANPGSMEAGLRAAARISAGHGHRRSWAVLGPMAELGDVSAGAHRDVGRLAAETGFARVVAVGPEAAGYLDGARTAGASEDRLRQVADVEAALGLLRTELDPGDLVFVKASRSAGLERIALALVAGPVPA